MSSISFILVHGIGDEKPGEISSKWFSEISPEISKKLNKEEREELKKIMDTVGVPSQKLSSGEVSIVEPRWEKQEGKIFRSSWKMIFYILPLLFFNITSFISSREKEIEILSNDGSKTLEELRVKYATLWLIFSVPIIIGGLFLHFGAPKFLLGLFILVTILIIFTINRKVRPFYLAGQIKSAALVKSSDAITRPVKKAIKNAVKNSDKVIIIAHSQGGYLSWRALNEINSELPNSLRNVDFIMVGSGLRAIYWLSKIAESRNLLTYFNISPLVMIFSIYLMLYNLPEFRIPIPSEAEFPILNIVDFNSLLILFVIPIFVLIVSFILGKLLDIKSTVESIPIPHIRGLYEIYSLDDPVARSRIPSLEIEPTSEVVPSSGIFLKDHSFSYYLNKSEVIKLISVRELLATVKKGTSHRYVVNPQGTINTHEFFNYKIIKSGFCISLIGISFLIYGAMINFEINLHTFKGVLSIIWIPAIFLMMWNVLDFSKSDRMFANSNLKSLDYNFRPIYHIIAISLLFTLSEFAIIFQHGKEVFFTPDLFLPLYICLVNSLGTVFAGNVRKLKPFKFGNYISIVYIVAAVVDIKNIFVILGSSNYIPIDLFILCALASMVCLFGILLAFYYLRYFWIYNKWMVNNEGYS